MTERFLDWTPETGTEVYEFDEANDCFHIHYQQDVAPTIEANKIMQNDGSNGFGPTRELQHVAEIPMLILHKWRTEEGIDWQNKDHWPAIVRKLRDPDWRYLRTDAGRI